MYIPTSVILIYIYATRLSGETAYIVQKMDPNEKGIIYMIVKVKYRG